MNIDWTQTQLAAGLAGYSLHMTDDVQTTAQQLKAQEANVSLLFLTLDGLAEYVAAWDIEAGAWLAVAVVRLVDDVLDNYRQSETVPMYGGNPTTELILLVPLEHEQEIVHRLLTGYQELYNILARTQRKAGNRFWHRRASTTYFPQLLIEVEDNEAADETSEEG